MRYTFADLFAIIAAVAIACAWPVLLVPITVFGASAFVGRKSRRAGIALAIVATCLYAPFSWLLMIDYGWGNYRLGWLNLWPILPGFVVGFMFHPNDVLEFSVMGATTLVLLVLQR